MSDKLQNFEWEVSGNNFYKGEPVGYEIEISRNNVFSPVLYSYLTVTEDGTDQHGRLYYSLNGGSTWVVFPSGQDGKTFYSPYRLRFDVSASDTGFIFAENDGNLYRIRPDGREVVEEYELPSEMQDTKDADIHVQDDSVFLLGEDTLYRFNTNGEISPTGDSINLNSDRTLGVVVDGDRQHFWQIEDDAICLKDLYGEIISCQDLGVNIDVEISSSSSSSSSESSSSSSGGYSESSSSSSLGTSSSDSSSSGGYSESSSGGYSESSSSFGISDSSSSSSGGYSESSSSSSGGYSESSSSSSGGYSESSSSSSLGYSSSSSSLGYSSSDSSDSSSSLGYTSSSSESFDDNWTKLTYWYENVQGNLRAEVTGFTVLGDGTIAIPAVSLHNDLLYPVTSIRYEAFKNHPVTSLDMTGATNLDQIGYSAFEGCTSLGGTITIPASVTKIDHSAFQESAITSLDLTGATSLDVIGATAFEGCTSLGGTITIPASVTAIWVRAFLECSSLDNAPVTFLGDAPQAGDDVFLDATPTTGTYIIGTSNWGATWSDLTMSGV